MRRIAIARSWGVRNQAFVGESGKKNLREWKVNSGQCHPTTWVHTHMPKQSLMLKCRWWSRACKSRWMWSAGSRFSYHCQGSKDFVLMCKDPKLRKPDMIWAMGCGTSISESSHSVSLCVWSLLPVPFIKTCWARVRKFESATTNTHTNIQLSESVLYGYRTWK